jgi:hypothetical protein
MEIDIKPDKMKLGLVFINLKSIGDNVVLEIYNLVGKDYECLTWKIYLAESNLLVSSIM